MVGSGTQMFRTAHTNKIANGFEPGPQRWKLSALSTAPPLLPRPVEHLPPWSDLRIGLHLTKLLLYPLKFSLSQRIQQRNAPFVIFIFTNFYISTSPLLFCYNSIPYLSKTCDLVKLWRKHPLAVVRFWAEKTDDKIPAVSWLQQISVTLLKFVIHWPRCLDIGLKHLQVLQLIWKRADYIMWFS